MLFTRPPWKYRGLCMTILYLVPTRKVQSLVPPPLTINEVVSGLTVGGVYAARHGSGGPEVKSEFGLLPAYVTYGGRNGFYMHNFCADSQVSVQGGKRSWSADKTLSEFNWEVGDKWISLDVATGGEPLISLRMRPILSRTPITASFPILCVKGSSVVFFRNHYASNVGISASTVSIPKGSPLSGFPFKLKLVSTFWDASNIVVKEPEFIHEGVLKRPENVLGNPIGKQM